MTAGILTVLLLMVFSAFFSGIEIAFVSASRLKIELQRIQGSRTGIVLSNLVKKTPQVLTTILLGNNLALVLYSISMSALLEPLFNYFFHFPLDANGGFVHHSDAYVVLIVDTLISTVIVIFFCEYIPKAIFRANPDSILHYSSWILNFVYKILSPFAYIITAMSKFMLKYIFRFRYEEEEFEFGKKDLDLYIQEVLSASENPITKEIDAEMFSNALQFNETRARDFMVPRTEIQAISVSAEVPEIMGLFIGTKYSRIIVFNENLDQVLGFVHTLSMFKKPATISEVLQPVIVVPESMPANIILSEFTRNRRTVAIVVDEFGGTAGLLTIEDLVEEVFGEIEDPHDEPSNSGMVEKQLDSETWIFSARCEIDYLNKKYGFNLPYGEYNTLGGLVMNIAQTIPTVNHVVQIPRFVLTVTDAEETRVKLIKLKKLPHSEMG